MPIWGAGGTGGSMSNAEVKVAYEANANTNAVTDAEKTVLGNTSGANTGDDPADDTAYNATSWNDNSDAATKNAIRDKIESMGAGAGDVVGPSSAVDDRIATFDSTTGKLIKDSGDTLSEYGKLDGDETVTGDWTFTGAISGLGNIFVNAALGTNNTFSGLGIAGLNAGETIAQWDLVYLDATSGEWLLADADAVGNWPAWGMAVEAGTDGNALAVVQRGTVRNDSWAWTPKAKLYLDETTAGGMTETAPSTSGDCIQPVAIAITADIILINIDPMFDYLEVA